MIRSRSPAEQTKLPRDRAPALVRGRAAWTRISVGALSAVVIALSATCSALLAAPPSPAPANTSAAAASPQVKTIYTREVEFKLPFQIDPADPASRRAVEVQLHVSKDGGNWKVESTAAPDERRLSFKAHGDGEYAFMVRTRDDRGELQPATPPAPELIVIVDTEPPVLELVAERGAPGEIRAHWRSSDPHLAPKSMRVEYQLGSAGARLPVAVDNPKVTATSAAGEATWIVDASAKKINIQAQVLDEAGNVAKILRPIDLVVATPDKSAEWRALGEKEPGDDVVRNWPGERTNDTLLGGGPPQMSNSFPNVDGPSPGKYEQRQYAGKSRRANSPQGEMVLPRESIAQQETLPAPSPETQLAQPGAEPVVPIPSGPDLFDEPRTPTEPRQASPRPPRDVENLDEGPRLTQAADGTEPVTPGEAVPAGPPAGYVQRPTGAKIDNPPPDESSEHPRMVKSERFELDYDVEEVGRAGVAKVEVWGTKNNGRTWESYGVDADNRSPIIVKVDGEGLYGFRIVIESGAGLRGDAPRPGDKPDVWVGVDTTKPMVRITGTEVGIGLQAGDIVIRWDAHDNLLAERPISLYYSTKAGGPWVTIATGLENTGRFVWRLDTNAPERVYFRIAVRDEAGNVEQYETPDPVGLDPVRPKGRIRSVRPAEEAAMRARRP